MIFLKKGITLQKIVLFFLFCCIFPIFFGESAIFAQERSGNFEDIWISPGAELSMYSVSNPTYGGGLSLGYGDKAAIGFKVAYLTDTDGEVSSLELNIFLRMYLLNNASISGPFIQVSGGPVFFSEDNNVPISSGFGSLSAGLSAGWRFLFGRYLYVEPAIRGGYPYIAGVVLSGGVHY